MIRNRFTNSTTLNSQQINGYEHLPIVTLEEAIEKIILLVPDIVEYVSQAKEYCNRNSTLLTWNESAAIYLYSMSIPFFSRLNAALRAETQRELNPWVSFLKLLINALEKLPPTKATLWRGVNYDDTLTFVDNDMHIWWGVTSCSMNPKTVQPFLGEMGTLFVIDAIYGKDISAFSAFPDEQEVILMPGTRVRAKSESLSLIDRLFVIHLEEGNLQRSQSELNNLFKLVKQIYQQNNRLERIMNPAISFPIEQSYINLAIVKAKEQQEKEKQLHNVQHDNNIMSTFEEIYGMKTTINIKSIFDMCKNHEKQVLVFGRAGIGKSTFCRYIAYQWAIGSYWSQYELLALIPLRRLTANRYPPLPLGQNYSLIDLIKKEVFSNDLSEKDETILKNQFDTKTTLWILDGYDEIIQNVPVHLEYLFEQLLKTPHHIITSRPYLNTLSYDVQMEITGFTDKNIVHYVKQFFNQMKDELDDASIKCETLLNFLKSNSSVWGVAHIPVNLELICSLWSNEDWSEIEQITITILYSMMTDWLCRRYLTPPNKQILQLSEEEIKQRCQKELAFLENLAFNSMKNNTIIIRPSLLKRALNETKVSLQDHPHVLNIGILKSFNKQGIGTQIETNKDHYFVHLSFQEYFAARYLINALKESSTENIIEFIKYQKYNQRYALVFTFAAGLLNESDPKICLDTYWNTILGEPRDLVGIRHMQLLISCIEETSGKLTLSRRNELLEWIAACIKNTFSKENKIIRKRILQSLQRASSVICHPIITNVLIDHLRYGDAETKAEVLFYISQVKFSNPSITLINSIITTLDDKNSKIRANACAALVMMGEKATTNEVINKLVIALRDENINVRMNARIVFKKMKLVGALEHWNEDVRQSSRQPHKMVDEKVETNEGVNKLVSTLENRSAAIRTIAWKTSGMMNETVMISHLLDALGDDNQYVRVDACRTLGNIGVKAATNEVISKLVNALGDDSEFVRVTACRTLAMIGETAATNKVISKLMIALENENENMRTNACEVFGMIGEKAATNEVVSKLVSAIEDKSVFVRTNVCKALKKMSGKVATNEVISKLANAIEDENENVSVNAWEALEMMGEKAATNEIISKLEIALGDERKNVTAIACKTLGRMGEKAATNEIISKLVCTLEHWSEDIRQLTCQALEKMGAKAATNEVISKLMVLMNSDSHFISGAAANAVQNILSSPIAITQLDPNIISYLCLSEYASHCLKNLSEDQLLHFFLITKNVNWLSAMSQFTLSKRVAVIVIEDKIVIYGSKEPLELPVPSLEVRQQLIETFTEQTKRLHLSFEVLSQI